MSKAYSFPLLLSIVDGWIWHLRTVNRHLVSERGIEVDKAKIDVIECLPPPDNVKGIAVSSKASLRSLDPLQTF